MTKKIRSAALVFATLTCLLCVAIGVFTLTPKSVRAEDYTSPLSSGYYVADYTVMDLAETYGTEVDGVKTISIATTAETNTSYALGEEKAVRFNMSASKQAWAVRFGLFCDSTNYVHCVGKAALSFEIRVATTVDIGLRIRYNSANLTSGGSYTFARPSWINFSSSHTYNVEVGAPSVYDESGVRQGILCYLELDGVRIAEQFVGKDVIDANFGGGYFLINTGANTTNTLIASSVGAIDLTDKATVTFDAESYTYKGTAVTPKPAVTAILEKEGVSYGQVIDQQYYDVTYQNNDKSGTATAIVTFKGKYTGTASKTFTVVDAFESWSVLPSGYTVGNANVIDLAETYGTETSGVKSITTTCSAETNYSYALGDANAVRFKMNPSTALGWGERFALFCKESYVKTDGLSSVMFELRKSGVLKVAVRENGKMLSFAPELTYPTWLNMTNGTDFNVEVGAPTVYDINGEYAGVLAYLEIEGARVAEVFIDKDTAGTDYAFSGGNFSYCCVPSNDTTVTNTITAYDLGAQDITGKVKASVASGGMHVADANGNAAPKLGVLALTTVGGLDYVQYVDASQYDVVYTDNDKAGTATATVTFKDKYSGTCSVNYDVVKVDIKSGEQTSSIYAMVGDKLVVSGENTDGKVFVGWDLNGTLYTAGDKVTVQEGMVLTAVFVEFETECTASIKALGTKGMRFITKISAPDKVVLENYGYTVTFGTRITSPSKAGYLDVATENWYSVSEDGTGYDSYTAVLTNFGEDDYVIQFTANGYLELAKDGATKRVYSYLNDQTYSRSIAQVAASVIEKDGYLTTDDGYDADIHVTEYNGKYYSYTQDEMDYFVLVASKYEAAAQE